MSDLNLIIRTADSTHKAEITIEGTQTCGDIIQASVEKWAMPPDTDYTIANVSKSPPQTLNPSMSLEAQGVGSGETLEIQPVLVAGGNPL